MADDRNAYSVGELLELRHSNRRWHLALVQREEVWDVDRMRRLLDSLLAGYPIGALLLCRTRAVSQIITRESGQSTVTRSEPDAWQLLDGQQRINALYTMLTTGDEDHHHYGRFFLDLSAARPIANPEAGRSDRQLNHIVCRRPRDLAADEGVDDFSGRRRCIDLSLVYQAAAGGAFDVPDDLTARQAMDVARRIDPSFEGGSAELEDRILDWVRRLVRLWRRSRVPVMRAEVDEPEDLLELFARLNRSGVPFSDADMYFAAVKTFWSEAEPSLKRVVDAATFHGRRKDVSFLDMMGALRLISRVAARSLGRGDVIPLRVSRIAGASREAMVSAMGHLTAEGSALLTQLARFTQDFGSESGLGFAARLVRGQLWDEVLAWAVVRGTWDRADLKTIDEYLVGASLFSYSTIFGTTFSTISLVEALAAASEGREFPADRILAAVRERYPELKRGNRQVHALVPPVGASARERVRLADGNATLLLSLAQRIPIDHPRAMDIDHIYASALAGRMTGDRPRSHHPQRWRINSVGNKWLLDYSLNRSLQDRAPRAKFEWLVEQLALVTSDDRSSMGSAMWAREQWAIEEHEIAMFHKVDELLVSADVERAMEAFTELTQSRADRLLHHATDTFPLIRAFALDHEPAASSADDLPAELTAGVAAEIASRLGLPEATEPERTAPAGGGGTAAGAWRDRGDELEWVMKEATRRHLVLLHPDHGARASPTQTGSRAAKHGFHYVRWVSIGAPEPRTHIGVGVPLDEARASRSPLWLVLHAQTPGHDEAVRRLVGAGTRPSLDDEVGAWLALEVDESRRWRDLCVQIQEQLTDVVEAISGRASE